MSSAPSTSCPPNSVLLQPGEYVIDQHYPIALATELVALALIVANFQQWENLKAKMSHNLFKVFLFYEALVLTQICIGITVNESRNVASYPWIRPNYENLVYTALAFHVISKAVFGAMLIYRCYLILIDRRIKMIVSVSASILVAAVAILISVLAERHVELFHFYFKRDFKRMSVPAKLMTDLNMAQIVLYITVTMTSTGVIFHYIGRNLMNNEGYYEYLRKSKSARLAVIFTLDQLTNLIWTALVSSGYTRMTRTYFHYQNFSLALAAIFYYYATFEDIKKAVRETASASKSLHQSNSKSLDKLGQGSGIQSTHKIGKTNTQGSQIGSVHDVEEGTKSGIHDAHMPSSKKLTV